MSQAVKLGLRRFVTEFKCTKLRTQIGRKTIQCGYDGYQAGCNGTPEHGARRILERNAYLIILKGIFVAIQTYERGMSDLANVYQPRTGDQVSVIV